MLTFVHDMIQILKKLSLGFLLMAGASAILLISDLRSRQASEQSSGEMRAFRVAILQNVSQSVLDDGVRGMIDGMAEKGYVDGKNLKLDKFNAEGDMATINNVARDITDGRYDLVLTVSTPCLQAVANANKNRQTKHVFAMVTDPVMAGVGITGEKPSEHPLYMAGYGTMQPVVQAFRQAVAMNPALKKVGVIWNSSETNSAAQLNIARAWCKENNIELMEASVDTSSGVGEAASALVARGVEAIWIPGDSTVLVAADAVVQAAKRGKIPAFSVIPPTVKKGAIFDLGANYHEVGRQTGLLAADILGGLDPALVPIVNNVPEVFLINKEALSGLKQSWVFTQDQEKRAQEAIEAQAASAKEKKEALANPAQKSPQKKWRLHLISYVKVLDTDEAEAGVREGLIKTGLVEGKDYELKTSNANGDMSTVSALVDAALTDRADMIITISTPTLQAALKRAGKTPIVFTYCANAVVAGAGKSDTDHMPTVTGVQTTGAYDELLLLVKECMPNVKTVGTLYVPSEVNMVVQKDKLVVAGKKLGIDVVAVAAETSGEVQDATSALCLKKIDAICQVSGNLTAASFPAVARAARQARMPLFATQGSQAKAGAPIVLARDYHDAGIDTAFLIARVIRGESPATIPFETFSRNRLILNPAAARTMGMTIPDSLYKRAEEIIKE